MRYGHWIIKGDCADCSVCGGHSGTQYNGLEPVPLMTSLCAHCGARNIPEKAGEKSETN